jgi:hypothetical protein
VRQIFTRERRLAGTVRPRDGWCRKEDSRLHGNVLSMFIKLSRCVRPTPGTTRQSMRARERARWIRNKG